MRVLEERLGFIREKLDIKILILFVLRRLTQPVPFETLSELALIDEGISYFDFTECVSELVETGHIETDGHVYAVTDKGTRNGEITENTIPYSVRLKAEKNAHECNAELNRRSHITASHAIRRKGGYTVSMSLSDGVSDVISMQLFAASQAQAQALESNFIKNAESIYNKILKTLLDES